MSFSAEITAEVKLATHDLQKREVSAIVGRYDSKEVTNQLYDFGKMMLAEIQDRASKVNSHSVMVLGWGTGTLAILFSQMNRFSGIPAYVAFAGCIAAFAAIVCSFLALKTRDEWTWPSDQSWIHENALGNEDELKRYYIRVIHDVRQRHLAITESKAHSLFWAEWAMIIAGIVLFVGTTYQVLLAKFPWVLASAKCIK